MTDTILTPPGLASFINIEKARAMPGVVGAEPRFSITLIFGKEAQRSAEFAALSAGIDAAIKERWPGKTPPNLKSPFHDGSEKAGVYKGYKAGDIFINPWSKNKPGCVNRQRQDVLDYSEFHAGWTARAFVKPFAFEAAGNKGVLLFLDTVQFLKPGPRLDGHKEGDDFPDDQELEDDEVPF